MPDTTQSTTQKTWWLDRKENVRKVYYGMWVLCGLLLVVEPFVHKHPEFAVDGWFGFYGWYGFFACVGLVLAAQGLRRILKRPEDYYER